MTLKSLNFRRGAVLTTIALSSIFFCHNTQATEYPAPVIGNISVVDNNNDGEFDRIVSGGSQQYVTWLDSSFHSRPTEHRAILEIDLEAFPESRRLEHALLQLQIVGISNTPNIEVWAYTGDGVLELEDATRGDTRINTQMIDSLGSWQIDVSDYVRSLLQQRKRYLGLNLRESSAGNTSNNFDNEIVFLGHQSTSSASSGVKLILNDEAEGAFSPQDTIYQHHFDWGEPGVAQRFEIRSSSVNAYQSVINKNWRMEQSNFLSTALLNELDWVLKLDNASNVQLHFFQSETRDEALPLPESFNGSVLGDGVSISSNGVQWYSVVDANRLNVGARGAQFTVDLDAEVERIRNQFDPNFGYDPSFHLRFQQEGISRFPYDGRDWGNLRVSGQINNQNSDLSVTSAPTITSTRSIEHKVDLNYFNHGPNNALGTVVDIDLPLSIYQGTMPDGCERSGQRITCYLGKVQQQRDSRLKLGLIPMEVGEHTLNISIRSAMQDSDTSDNSTSLLWVVEPNSNHPPELSIASNPLSAIVEGTPITFRIFELFDPDFADTHQLEWDLDIDGNVTESQVVEHTFIQDGNYQVRLTATDQGGLSDTDNLTIQVLNAAPQVNAGLDQVVDMLTPVNFSGQYTDAGIADIHQFAWSFGDDTLPSTNIAASHIYTAPGTYTTTFTVTDDGGATGTDSTQITVNPAPILSTTLSAQLISIGEDPLPTPNCVQLSLNNTSVINASWQLNLSQSWLQASTLSGQVNAGGSYEVDLCLTDEADSLAPGFYNESIQLIEQPSGLQHNINLQLTVPSPLPPIANFDELPSALSGWEYYSSNNTYGRIQAIGGQLRMDVSQNNQLNLNEAVLTADLLENNGVTLSFFQADFGDESHTMPSTFNDHVNADGVAISADGVTWYRAIPSEQLETSTEGNTYLVNLDQLVSNIRAKYDSDFTYTSNFKIKFQQYDDYSHPTDGRGWDNIELKSSSSNFRQTLAEGFTLGHPNTSSNWQYYSSNPTFGRIQASGTIFL